MYSEVSILLVFAILWLQYVIVNFMVEKSILPFIRECCAYWEVWHIVTARRGVQHYCL